MLPRLGVSIWPLLLRLARAGLVNVTIDDSSADPRTGNSIVYDPPTTWNTQAGCQQGPVCLAQPDKSIIFDGTWHESSFFPTNSHPITASFEFSGRAVYVYCVIPISIAPSGNSDMTFSIDGQVSGTYVHGPPGLTGGYKYDTLVFSHSLSPGSHKLDITNGRIGTTLTPAGMILDRIVYSFEEDPPPALPSLGLPPPRSSSPLSTTAANPSTSESPSDPAGPALTTEIPVIGSSSRAGSPATSSGHSEFTSSGQSGSTSSPDLSSSTNPTSSTGEVLPADPSLTANPSAPSGSPLSPKSPKPSIGSIIGAILGALFTVLVIIIILLLCRRRRRQARAAAILASKTSQIPDGDLRGSFHRNSYYASTPIDPFGAVQIPSPTQSRRPFPFRNVASPATSPTSPGEVDPYPLFGDRNAPANMLHVSQGWMVGSDSKRALLDASTAPPPPAFHLTSPTDLGGIDPYPVFSGHNAPANMRHTSRGWSVGSDSKKALLDADGALPPGYYD